MDITSNDPNFFYSEKSGLTFFIPAQREYNRDKSCFYDKKREHLFKGNLDLKNDSNK